MKTNQPSSYANTNPILPAVRLEILPAVGVAGLRPRPAAGVL